MGVIILFDDYYPFFTKYIIMLILKSRLGGLLRLKNSTIQCVFMMGTVKFHLPDLGEKIKEGTIKKLYIKEGDHVEEFQKLADVASDKQFTELTASDSGVIRKIYYKQEDVCQVGDLFLEIEKKGTGEHSTSSAQSSISQAAQVKVQSASKSATQTAAGVNIGIVATPFVRGLIKKHGLDISAIKGTGQKGRILQIDIDNIINKTKSTPQQQPKIQPKPQTQTQPQPQVQSHTSTSSIKHTDHTKTIVMSGFQKGMQKSMTQSNTIPHLYLHEELDITQVQRMRKALKDSNRKVTVMGILIKTFSLALKHYPKMNALYYPQKNPFEYELHSSHNISIAIDSPNGLVVPHIKNVEELNLGNIQSELQRLRNLAKQAKLTSKQLQGGTVCLSNIGTIGGTNACPLILPPQACIVAIGKLQSLPRFQNGQVVQRKIINVSYGCDHRVIDGATVARFSNHWKQLIQNPYLSIAEMV